jgi:hypothetical protein
MRREFSSSALELFTEGAARAFYAQAWATRQYERGRSLTGRNILDAAPATPLSAYVEAGVLVGKIEELNRKNIYMIFAEASKADGRDVDVVELGHYFALQALGEGVSWFDSHASFPVKLPHMEYNLP